jgi:poly(A) polymerase
VTDGAKGREPRILGRPDHTISRSNIDDNALKVLHRLHRARRLGYMVGGAVRDLLLDRKPKDYDIATDARPPEVRRLFRNSRIIGRRFRLAHVYFKEGIVEVATFRRDPDPGAQQGADGELLITDDNVFGTPEEDAFRRDFTVNALFYNIADYSVIDYVDGIEDPCG